MTTRFSNIIAFVIAVAVPAPAAHAQTGASPVDEARADIEYGRYADARTVLQGLVAQDPENSEAHYLLARIYQEAEPVDLKKARDHNDRAIDLQPRNAEYLALRLARSHFFGSSFLPALRTRQKQDLAEKILDLEPENEMAHLVLGEIALDDYLNARRSVSFPDLDDLNVPAPREAFYNAAYLLNPVLAPGVDADGIDFRTSRRYAAREIEYVRKDDEARKRYGLAVEHLTRAIESNGKRKATYEALLTAAVLAGDLEQADRAAARMVSAIADDPDAWLYRGYVSFRLNQVEEAEDAFDKALRMMGPDRAREFEDTARFGQDSVWSGRDPFLLTSVNERRLEHLARMVYADLRFGELFRDTPGWRTEPGDVVVRYGVPIDEAQTSTRQDKYLILHYGDFFFKFMDLAKSGKLTFYSPKVGSGGPDPNEIERAIEEDYTLISQRIFREVPERFIYDRHGTRKALPYAVSAFKGDGESMDVYVTFGVGTDGDDSAAVQSGVWLLDEAGTVMQESSGEAAAGMRVARDDEWYQVYTRRLGAIPGQYTVAVEYLSSSGDEAGFHRRPVEMMSVPSEFSSVSDLMLAYMVEEGAAGGSVVRGGYSVEPAPWGVFRAGQPVYVFFETYNLAVDADRPRSYHIEALMSPHKGRDDLDGAVRKAFERGSRRGVSVAYTAEARSDVEPQYLILDTSESRPGTYLVGLRLTDADSGYESFAGRAIILE